MELIELHILQSFPVTCLNRDDVGAPKSAFFGGVQRARVSSQSWKRPIRSMASELQPDLFAGTRTRFVIRDLKKRFLEKEVGEEEAQQLAEVVADTMGKLDSVEKGNVKTLLYFSPMEMQNVVEELLQCDLGDLPAGCVASAAELARAKAEQDKKAAGKAEKKLKADRKKLSKLCEKPTKKLKSAVKDAADISLFGRMVADDHSLMVEGAGLFSHALSTHRATNEVEFFSAVDDRAEVGDEGAGHIGTLEFNSACYYRYVGVNLDLLRDEDHLGHFDDGDFRTVIETFLRSALLAVPGARKNSMFGFNPPAFVLGLRRRGQPLSLVNAFEEAVRPSNNKGYVEPSRERLLAHHEALKKTYKLDGGVEVCLPEVDIDEFIAGLLEGKDGKEG